MNTGFYKDLDTNFELACKMSEQEFNHETLLNLLKTGNIPEKQIAALKLTTINNKEEALILMSNLTGCDGKIREAVALKINQLITKNPELTPLFTEHNFTPFADATIDINGNICRLVIDSVAILKKDYIFAKKYLEQIFFFINETYTELDKFIFRDKKYVINKQLFKLYWCLEALKLFTAEVSVEKLLPLLERGINEKEYTIREKVAQILVLLNDSRYNHLIETLKNDENYYVRQVFNS